MDEKRVLFWEKRKLTERRARRLSGHWGFRRQETLQRCTGKTNGFRFALTSIFTSIGRLAVYTEVSTNTLA